MDQAPHANRRKYPRHAAAAVLVALRRVEGGDPKLGRVVDLGRGGVRFRCFTQDLAVGEVIEATLILNEYRVTVVGKAVRVTNKGQTQEVALAFKRAIDPETLKRLCEVGPAETPNYTGNGT